MLTAAMPQVRLSGFAGQPLQLAWTGGTARWLGDGGEGITAAGKATLRGTDMGVKWLATRKIDLAATFSWTDLTDVEAPAGTPANLTELTSLNSPPIKWTAGANIKEFLPKLSGGFTARHVTGYVFRSGINFFSELRPGALKANAPASAGLSEAQLAASRKSFAEDQARLLCGMRCDELQGFLFSEAMPAQAIDRLIQNGDLPPDSWRRGFSMN